MVLSIVALVFAVMVLVYNVRLTLVYHRFNEQIRQWSQSLDDDMLDAVNRAARRMLRELDEKISEQRALERQELENEEDVEPLNNEVNIDENE